MTYTTYNQMMQQRWGKKVYKLSLTAAHTCPNRDGTCGVGGCIFCSSAGSGTFAADGTKPVSQQIEDAKALVRHKGAAGFVAYFQSFTTTHMPAEKLEPMLLEAANHRDILEVSVATRPDCLPNDILAVLAKVAAICPLTVELGLQTIHSATAQLINRCYPLEVYDEAVEKLHGIGAAVVTHLILGLPGETQEDMVESARYVGKVTDGIKLQLLHILHGTKLAQMYEEEPFPLFTLESYCETVGKCLQALPPNVVIHRLTGDGAKKDLIAPLWSADKKRVMGTLQEYLRKL